MVTLGQIIERNERCFPQRPALRCGDVHLSHGQYARRVRRLAHALHARGLRRQQRLSVLAMNSAAFIEVFGAAEWAGYVINTVNFRLAPPEMLAIIRDAGAGVLIFDAQYADVVDSLRAHLPDVHHYICIDGCIDGATPVGIPEWAEDYETVLASGDEAGPPFRAQPGDLFCLVYTSGTTGRAKGVAHTHESCVRIAEVLSSELGLDGDTRLLAMAPVFHMGARTLSQGAHFRGGCVVLHRGFDAEAVNRCFEEERITAVHLVPTMVQSILDAPNFGHHDFSSLRMLMYAAAPMPVPLLKRAVAAFGPITYNGYGQTEINGLTFLRPHQHVLDGDAVQTARLASVGQPHWQCELRIVDEQGRVLPPGEVGEVCARSPTAMAGYWNNSTATLETVRDGWVHTGDMGYLDDEQFLFLVDRKKDMIISGGENVYSREVEEALLLHDAVLEAAVIGVPDAHWGEAVKAVVVARPGATPDSAALIAFCRTHIAGYKCPKSVEWIAALPRLPTGKINKVELRQRYSTPTH